ncbi:shikimate dehydrogenase family protein [Winogradskyella alexanderae]|uniref:Shikimate dehydrogenase n=1 Tax=Winogradskyella alexanderae TaxID=2877123 RepID=A0ABS7XQQ4_9FLAO|nr:shikimate dehydrogenase [Winogradskyella alexanderae]MCA0132105.1 shikimate dehydrogenase [Winogradskyella alexanderae]
MDNGQDKSKLKFGLIGRNISYSFSRGYFAKKFEKENLNFTYENFDLTSIDKFPVIFENNPNLKGLNVTIPYKEQIIPYLDKVSKKAQKIGAVNTIRIKNKKIIGYNTDYYGFKKSITPHLTKYHKNALILGTGGASKAIAYALEKLQIEYDFVSRNKTQKVKYQYSDLTPELIRLYKIIINCTPVGTYPNVDQCPNIPYEGITSSHILYDLIYNPERTKFLQFGEMKGAAIINGLQMLELQAEKSWEIWNRS